MKSDRQAARMALSCFALGRCGAVAARGAAGAGRGAAAAAGGAVMGCAVTGGAATADGVAAAGVARTTFWQAGESPAALARRHSRSSGFPGAIQEQCDMKSLSVQASWTAVS